MDLTSLLNSTESPWLITLLLAVVFALDPCAILTNIAAIGYVGRDIENPRRVFRNGLWYTLGRTLAFGILGGILMWLVQRGEDVLHVREFFAEYGELLLVPFLFLMGVLMIVADFVPFFRGHGLPNGVESGVSQNAVGSLLMGAVLSLAFCPTNATIFFGMIFMPQITFWHILLFAVVVALPVLVIAWILAFSFDSISRFYEKIRNAGKWFRWGVGGLFILLGIFFLIEHLCE